MDEDQWWKSTQLLLQPLLPNGPQLTEKHLKRPPFRFVHDIFTALTKVHGFGDGLLEDDEQDPKAISEKPQKIAVLTKIIDYTGAVHRERLDVEPKAIVSGKSAEKTNEFLRQLAQAVTLDNKEEHWKRALRACGQDPDSLKEREAREKEKAEMEENRRVLQIDTGLTDDIGEPPSLADLDPNEPASWSDVVKHIAHFRRKLETAGVDVKACKSEKKGKDGMGTEIRSVQEEILAAQKRQGDDAPTEQGGLDALIQEDEEELAREIDALVDQIRVTTNLTMENEQIVERIFIASGVRGV